MRRKSPIRRSSRGYRLQFPRDHGAHPEYRTEWWYVTGWLDGPLGFQVTFFRARPEEESDNPSSFNPRQILFAHAALSDPKRGRLVHDQRAARAGFSLAQAETERTGVWIDDWRWCSRARATTRSIAARDFDLDLTLFARAAVLQGEAGFSRKGHRPEEASYYYSRPQLDVVGKVNGATVDGHGVARPRMVERLPRARGRGLGLGRHQLPRTAAR